MKKNLELEELRSKDNQALFTELKESERKIVDLKFKSTFKKLKNYKEIALERKKAARIWTILAERAIKKLENTQEKSGEKDEQRY